MKNLITQMQALMIDALINGNYTILAMPTNDRLSIDIDGYEFEIYRFEEYNTLQVATSHHIIPKMGHVDQKVAFHSSTEKYEAYRKAHRKLQIEEQQIALANELKTL